MPARKVEMNLGGTWTDVTADDLDAAFAVRRRVRLEAGIPIQRGRQDAQGTVSAGRMSLELNNQDGKYSPRNPLSAYFGQLNRNTPIRVGVDPMSDTFTRTVVDGWGTSSSGHAWTVVNGTAANFDVGGSAGTIVTNSNTLQVATLPITYKDVTVRCKVNLSSVANNAEAALVLLNDTTHYIRLGLNTAFPSNQLRLLMRNGAVTTTLATGTATISAGVDYWLAFEVGKRLRGKFWAATDPEPDDWGIDFLDETGVVDGLRVGPIGLCALTNVGSTATTASFDDLSVISYRFHGEVSSWPPRSDKSGADVSVPLEAAGLLDRLGSSGQAQLQSPMYREATKPSVSQYIAAYWPCEDSAGATQCGSALTGGPPMTFTGTVDTGQTSTIPGSKSMAVFGTGGNFYAPVATPSLTNGKVYFRIVLDVPDSPSTPDQTTLFNLYLTGGSFIRCAVVYYTAGGGGLEIRATTADGTVLESADLAVLTGKRFYQSVELVQSGGNISVIAGRNYINDDGNSVRSTVVADTWVGMTVGACYAVSGGGSSQMDGWGFCHLGVGSNQAFMFSMANALVGNSGETAGDRAARVAGEAGIALQVVGDPDDTAVMGPQIQGSALDVLRSCEAADGGVLYESRNELGLTYRTLASMYNQDGPTLDYAGRQVNVLEPVDDDQSLFNDVTVTRIAGSSARATLDSGSLSTQEPPDGAGRIEAPTLDVNVRYDAQLADVAMWRLHIGTWDEQRYRTLGVQHAAAALQADTDLRAQLAALDTGDMLAVDNPPTWLPPDQIRQLVQGYTEVIGEAGADVWSQDWNTTPYGPFVVAEADGDPRVDTDGTERTGTPIASGASSATFTITNGEFWVTGDTVSNPTDFPIPAMLGGEEVSITAIAAPSGNTQLFTITRSVNGVVKSHPVGTKIHVRDPAYAPL